jgi:hypothetical protein
VAAGVLGLLKHETFVLVRSSVFAAMFSWMETQAQVALFVLDQRSRKDQYSHWQGFSLTGPQFVE